MGSGESQGPQGLQELTPTPLAALRLLSLPCGWLPCVFCRPASSAPHGGWG